MSGFAQFLNDEQSIQELKLNMKFADSLEAVKHAERERKEHKAKTKRDEAYTKAWSKMGLAKDSVVFKKHVRRTKLTIPQMKAIAFTECGGEIITGNAAQLRDRLIDLLPTCDATDSEEDDGFKDLPPLVPAPEYATQDDYANIVIDLPIDNMNVNDCVEVYWKGDREWYEGRITAINLDEKQFEVEYFMDGKTLVHNEAEYKVRLAC